MRQRALVTHQADGFLSHVFITIKEAERKMDILGLFQNKRSKPLKPFVLQTPYGFILGLAHEPSQGSPCVTCVQKWLAERNVEAEPIETDKLSSPHQELMNQLIKKNDCHTYYEVSHEGFENQLNCFVFPHPECSCTIDEYQTPQISDGQELNLSFSPIYHLRAVRYSTPRGNLWHVAAVGLSPLRKQLASSYATHRCKDKAKLEAVRRWLCSVAEIDYPRSQATKNREEFLGWSQVEAGRNKQTALVKSLQKLSLQKILYQYQQSSKRPLFVSESYSYLRQYLPQYLVREYDAYLTYYPTSEPVHVLSLVLVSRHRPDEPVTHVFAVSHDIKHGIEQIVAQAVSDCRPLTLDQVEHYSSSEGVQTFQGRMNRWWQNWIYQCPKIRLNDLLKKKSYPQTWATWKEHLRRCQEKLVIETLNNKSLPKKLSHVLRVQRRTAHKLNQETGIVVGATQWMHLKGKNRG